MSANAVEVQGTLREDGTLVLDRRPDLPPGRVKVTVQRVPPAEGEKPLLEFLKEIHAAQALRGHVPRSAEEIDAYLEDSRAEGEREQLIERIQEECRREREKRREAEGR